MSTTVSLPFRCRSAVPVRCRGHELGELEARREHVSSSLEVLQRLVLLGTHDEVREVLYAVGPDERQAGRLGSEQVGRVEDAA